MVAAMLLIGLALLPALFASRQRPVRSLRAWALGAELLDDRDVMFQTTNADCGHAALMMVLRHHGRRIPAALLDEASTARWGLTIGQLVERGNAAGLTATAVRVPGVCIRRVFERIRLPAIVLLGTHYVVVESRPTGAFLTVVDPGVGRLRAPLAMLENDWREVVVAFGESDKTFEEASQCTDDI